MQFKVHTLFINFYIVERIIIARVDVQLLRAIHKKLFICYFSCVKKYKLIARVNVQLLRAIKTDREACLRDKI